MFGNVSNFSSLVQSWEEDSFVVSLIWMARRLPRNQFYFLWREACCRLSEHNNFVANLVVVGRPQRPFDWTEMGDLCLQEQSIYVECIQIFEPEQEKTVVFFKIPNPLGVFFLVLLDIFLYLLFLYIMIYNVQIIYVVNLIYKLSLIEFLCIILFYCFVLARKGRIFKIQVLQFRP